jgi:hypothetical protein
MDSLAGLGKVHSEHKAKHVQSVRGRRPQARVVDCGQHPSGPEVSAVRWREADTGNRGRDSGCCEMGRRDPAGN